MSSDAPVQLPRTQLSTSRLDTNDNDTSDRPTATRSLNIMTSDRATPTSVTSQGSNTSQSDDPVRMLDGK